MPSTTTQAEPQILCLGGSRIIPSSHLVGQYPPPLAHNPAHLRHQQPPPPQWPQWQQQQQQQHWPPPLPFISNLTNTSHSWPQPSHQYSTARHGPLVTWQPQPQGGMNYAGTTGPHAQVKATELDDARRHLGKACGICGKSLKVSLAMCSAMCCLVNCLLGCIPGDSPGGGFSGGGISMDVGT